MKKSCRSCLIFVICLLFLSFFSFNCSADEAYDAVEFDGKGSSSSPYLIHSADDFLDLKKYIEAGLNFKGKYLRQTNDIDFSSEGNWSAIGASAEGASFSGIYDGDGHVLRNIDCHQEIASLFYTLDGTLINLVVENGVFEGNEASAFAHQISEQGMVVNCYNRSNLSGSRTGGISVSNYGRIIASWNKGELYGSETADICLDGNGSVEYCPGSSSAVGKNFYGYEWENNFKDGWNFKEINSNLAHVYAKSGLKYRYLKKYDTVAENISFSTRTIGILDVLLSETPAILRLIATFLILAALVFGYILISKTRHFQFNRENMYIFLLVVTSLIFNLMFVNRNMNHIVGWNQFCARLMDDGKFPYRDYFYYLPPLYLWLARAIIKVTNGNFLLYRVYGIVERIVIQIIIFKILKRFFKMEHVWLASFLGELISCLSLFDGYGDYNQTKKLLIVLNVYFAVRFFESLEGKKSKKICCLWMAALGCSLGLGVLCVQTGLVYFATILIVLAWYFISKKQRIGLAYIFDYVVSFSVPIIAASIYLYANGALGAFIDQIFLSGNSKGEVGSIILNFFKGFIKIDSLLLAAALIVLCCLIYQRGKWNERKWYKPLLYGDVCLTLYFSYQMLAGNLSSLMTALSNYKILLALLVLAIFVLLLCFHYQGKKEKDDAYYIERDFCLIGGLVVFFLCLNVIVNSETIADFYNASSFFSFKNLFSYVAFYLSLAFILFEFIHLILYKTTKYHVGLLVFVSISAAYQFVNFIGAGTNSFSANSSALWFPLLFCILFDIVSKRSKFLKIAALLAVLLISNLSVAQRISVPYNWYGWWDGPVNENNAYTIDLPGMEGMRVKKRDKLTFEQVTKLIKENSDEDDFVFTFPHIKLYNILSDRMEMPTFVPCYWFDVCPDKFADIDAEILKTTEPELIVWCDVGENAWKIHEDLFRNGNPSSQRKIQEWFNTVTQSKYQKIGQVSNVSVYKKISEKEVKYSIYLEDTDNTPREFELNYGSMVKSLSEVMNELITVKGNLRYYLKYFFYIATTIAGLLSFHFAREPWEKLLSLLLWGNLIFQMYPIFYLGYSLVLYLLIHKKRRSRQEIFYIFGTVLFLAGSIWGFSGYWQSINVILIFLSAILFLSLILKNGIIYAKSRKGKSKEQIRVK